MGGELKRMEENDVDGLYFLRSLYTINNTAIVIYMCKIEVERN